MKRLANHAIAYWVASPWWSAPLRGQALYAQTRGIVIYDRVLNELEA